MPGHMPGNQFVKYPERMFWILSYNHSFSYSGSLEIFQQYGHRKSLDIGMVKMMAVDLPCSNPFSQPTFAYLGCLVLIWAEGHFKT